MTNPSGPIVILCGYDSSGNVIPCTIDADGALVTAGASTAVDASDVTYTPATAADWDGGTDPGNQNQANDQLAERVKDIELVYLSTLLPVRASWNHDHDYVVTGAAIVSTVIAAQITNMVSYQSPGANGDTFRNSAVLKPGAYTIALLGRTYTSFGKLDIKFKHIDDAGYTTIVSGQDWYVGGIVDNVIQTATFTVVTAGRHIFDFVINGKNGSSSGYDLQLSKVDIYLTAGDS